MSVSIVAGVHPAEWSLMLHLSLNESTLLLHCSAREDCTAPDLWQRCCFRQQLHKYRPDAAMRTFLSLQRSFNRS